MLNIRRGVFETNSSSSHSIVMTNKEHKIEQVDPGWRIRDDGELWFNWYEELHFGRTPFELLTDWYGRLRYYIAEFIDGEGPELDELTEICRKRIDGFDHFKFPVNTWDDTIDYGYVDHQSSGMLRNFIGNHNLSAEDFIFNDQYIIVIDGDEYNVFDTLQKTPMYNADNVMEVY